MLQAIDVAKFFLALDTDREIFGLNLITVTGIWSCTENDLPTIAWLDECVAVNVEYTEISE